MSEHGHHHDRGLKGALRYLRHAPRMWRSEVNAAVVELVDPRPGERVADIGAGMGPAMVLAAQRGAAVCAVDPTDFMRMVLRVRRALSRHRDRIEVRNGAAEDIPAGDGSIAAAWAVNAMHHWTDPAAAAAELHRVLRPGGRLVLVDEDFDDPRHELHEEMADRHGHGADHEMHMVDVDAIAALLRDAGFADVEADHADVAGQPCRRILACRS